MCLLLASLNIIDALASHTLWRGHIRTHLLGPLKRQIFFPPPCTTSPLWYNNCNSIMCVDFHTSSSFQFQRGVHQGSILSPSLILLMMDPLLQQLQNYSPGISVNNAFTRGYLHAKDIHTLANSLSSLKSKIKTVSRFSSENF